MAKRRLIFDEFFFLQFVYALKKREIKEKEGIIFDTEGKKYKKLFNSLPFKLTEAQKRVVEEIKNDFKSGKPMNRLLQGDVGSGKTIVALLTAIMAVDSNYQVAIMAPTEILATQHMNSISKFLNDMDVKVALLLGLRLVAYGQGNNLVPSGRRNNCPPDESLDRAPGGQRH